MFKNKVIMITGGISSFGNTVENILKNANSFAPILPGVGIGETAIYKSVCKVII